MGKHAYLIMCHNNLPILNKLVDALDDPRNDIYIHVDRKVKQFETWKRQLRTKEASLTFTKRINVNWGGYSQIEAELMLLETAVKQQHDYYHLLSGVDMPLKTQDEIHAFFEENQGKEFVGIDEKSENGVVFSERLRYHRFLQDSIGRNPGRYVAVLERLEAFFLTIQKCIGINRLNAYPGPVYKGTNWFSVTHHMAGYVLSRRKEIVQRYRHCLCADEIFLQTVAMESPYREHIVNDCLRCIDWERGMPYTYTLEDYPMLMNSGKLFARKFDEKTDFTIVEKIWETVRQ